MVDICKSLEKFLNNTATNNTFCYSKYSVQRSTSHLGVSYYVKPDFSSDYQGSIRRLEQHVEEDFVSTLRNACFKEKNYSKLHIHSIRSVSCLIDVYLTQGFY